MVELYSRAGRADRARALFAEYSAGLKDTATARLTTSSRHLAAGYVALAEHRYPEAIREIAASDTEYDGFPAGVCEVCNGLPLAQAYDAGGQVDRAIPLYERFVSSTDATAFTSGLDGWYLVDTYRRLGELYEAKGDKRKAAGYYQQVLGWWKNADPELQPTVTEVRKRLARLGDLEKR